MKKEQKKVTLKEVLNQNKTTIDDIMHVISHWVNDNEGMVSFQGTFWEIDKKKLEADADDIFSDDRIIAFGDKATLLIDLEELIKNIKEEKEDFIDWA